MRWLNGFLLLIWLFVFMVIAWRKQLFHEDVLTPEREQWLQMLLYASMAMIAWNGMRLYWTYTVWKQQILRQAIYEAHAGPLAEKDMVAIKPVVAPEFQFDETSKPEKESK